MRNMLLILCVPLLLLVNACKDPCKKVECLNNGICVEGNCLCPDDYSGANCEANLCQNVSCQNGGTCENGSCNCPTGFSGAQCEIVLCPGGNCFNGGVCNQGTCDCPPAYEGANCEIERCAAVNCQNGGTCVNGTCICPDGFSGPNCEIDLCAGINCQNGGTCVNGTCDCPDGYEGNNCEIDLCAGVNCQNGGTCDNGNCDCPAGYGGTNCEIDLSIEFIMERGLLYLDDGIMTQDWEPNDPFGSKPDIQILAWREGYNRNNCHSFQFNLANLTNNSTADIPIEWLPEQVIVENATYYFEIGDWDAASCPHIMYLFSGTMNETMSNPIILYGDNADTRLEIYWRK